MCAEWTSHQTHRHSRRKAPCGCVPCCRGGRAPPVISRQMFYLTTILSAVSCPLLFRGCRSLAPISRCSACARTVAHACAREFRFAAPLRLASLARRGASSRRRGCPPYPLPRYVGACLSLAPPSAAPRSARGGRVLSNASFFSAAVPLCPLFVARGSNRQAVGCSTFCVHGRTRPTTDTPLWGLCAKSGGRQGAALACGDGAPRGALALDNHHFSRFWLVTGCRSNCAVCVVRVEPLAASSTCLFWHYSAFFSSFFQMLALHCPIYGTLLLTTAQNSYIISLAFIQTFFIMPASLQKNKSAANRRRFYFNAYQASCQAILSQAPL